MRIDSAIITGSFSVNGDTFNDLGVFPSTGSNTFVGNQSIVGAVSASALTGSINYTNITNVPTLVSGSEQIVSILSPLNSFTASNSTTNTFTSSATARLNSIETISASNVARLNAVEIVSASNIARINSLESTSASVDTLNTTQNTRLTNLESITGSLATTGSNTFIGTQTITGSLFISSNLIVQGTSSLQNITASAVSIGTNLINLNTANPAIRYAGLVIGDSGSVGGSGSFLYDSVQDEMIFIHRGTSTVVTSSIVLMGPQTFDTIGTETYPTNNIIQKGTGNEHLVDSCIYESGGCVGINTNTPGGTFDAKTGACSNIVFTGDCANVSTINSYSTTNGFQTLKYAAGTHMFFAGAMGGGTMNEAMRITCCGTMVVGYNKAGTTDTISRTLTLGGRPDIPHLVSLGFDSGCAYRADLDFSGTTGKFEFYNYNTCWSTSRLSIDINGNVGIGISNPIDKLEVAGGIHTSGTAAASKACTGYLDYHVGQVRLGVIGPNTTTPAIFRIDQYSSNASISRTPFYINANGCVGIGTVTPKMHLTFADGIYQRILLNDNANNYSIGVANSVAGGDAMIKFIAGCSASGCGEVGFYSSSDLRFLIKKDGDLVSCGTGGFIMTQGTTAQRPTAVTGTMRYNSTFNLMEFYNGTSWVQMGSGDLATAQCINNTTMCHSVYQAAGTTGLIAQGSPCISLYGAAAPSMATSNTSQHFGTHGGHCGVSDFPGYWAVHLGGARAVNQLKVWIHTNSWGYFELQGSNNSGNASGFNQSGNWTTLSFLCSTNSNCQNMGGYSSGCTDGTIFTFWYTNNVPFSAYRIKILDSSRQVNPFGTYYGGAAGYVWQLNRV